MEENKKNKIYKIIMLVIITSIITFMLTSISMYNYFINTDEGNIKSLVKYIEISEDTENITNKLEVVKKYLEEYCISDLDIENMRRKCYKRLCSRNE